MCEWQAFVFTSRASWGKEKHDIYLIPHLLIKMEFPCLLNFLPHGVHSKELTIYPFVLSRTSDDFANPATIEHKSLRSHAGTLWLNHTMTWGSLRSGNAQTANGRGKCNPTSAPAQPGTDLRLGALSLGGKFPTVAEGKGGRLKKKKMTARLLRTALALLFFGLFGVLEATTISCRNEEGEAVDW